jgi:hypothetical protein
MKWNGQGLNFVIKLNPNWFWQINVYAEKEKSLNINFGICDVFLVHVVTHSHS